MLPSTVFVQDPIIYVYGGSSVGTTEWGYIFPELERDQRVPFRLWARLILADTVTRA